jgi:ribosomal protein S18 acetylase RimI-like enzyme
MTDLNIIYKIKTAGIKHVVTHLLSCKDDFIPALDKTVDIAAYSKKIVENAITFEAWKNEYLVGLIAVYCNDVEKKTAFITNVSVLNEFSGKGIAGTLLKNSISYITAENFRTIKLEVNQKNKQAINLYKKHKFDETALNVESVTMSLNLG